MSVQTATTALPRLIQDQEEARRELTRRRGFEETDLSPRMQEGIRRVFGADLTADEVVDRILGEVRDRGRRGRPALLRRVRWRDAIAIRSPTIRVESGARRARCRFAGRAAARRRADRRVPPQAAAHVLARLQRRRRPGPDRAPARPRRHLHARGHRGLPILAPDDRHARRAWPACRRSSSARQQARTGRSRR